MLRKFYQNLELMHVCWKQTDSHQHGTQAATPILPH